MNIIIIGASFSGIQCALRAKELYPYDKVILIEQEEEIGYLPSGLTLKMNGSISSLDEAVFISRKILDRRGIDLQLKTRVTGFDFFNQIVQTTKGEVSYDRLVLAMGSSQNY